ncbi:hypothetical protein B0H14DRAFT_3428140 [Mycena olivaceomarginata]|nr:hypothetical protein B0H14DRAFT_3428140 [Mycena olivaceomarginata]
MPPTVSLLIAILFPLSPTLNLQTYIIFIAQPPLFLERASPPRFSERTSPAPLFQAFEHRIARPRPVPASASPCSSPLPHQSPLPRPARFIVPSMTQGA